jgi:hypothetical protein
MRRTFFFICSFLLLSCESPKDLSNPVEGNSSKNPTSILENPVSSRGNSNTPVAVNEILNSEKEEHIEDPLFFLFLEFTRH